MAGTYGPLPPDGGAGVVTTTTASDGSGVAVGLLVGAAVGLDACVGSGDGALRGERRRLDATAARTATGVRPASATAWVSRLASASRSASAP